MHNSKHSGKNHVSSFSPHTHTFWLWPQNTMLSLSLLPVTPEFLYSITCTSSTWGKYTQEQKISFLPEKSFINGTDSSQGLKAFQSICISTDVVCPDTLFPTHSTSFLMTAIEYRERGPDDPESANNGDIKMEYSTD